MTDYSLQLSQKSSSVDILPGKHFSLLLPEEEHRGELQEVLERIYLLVKNRKNGNTRRAINSSKRESYIEYVGSWVEA